MDSVASDLFSLTGKSKRRGKKFQGTQLHQIIISSVEMTRALESDVVCIVHNIPKCFHASDLRNYFSQFVEKAAFTCFHYRHRPEVHQTSDEGNGGSEPGRDGAGGGPGSDGRGHSQSSDTDSGVHRSPTDSGDGQRRGTNSGGHDLRTDIGDLNTKGAALRTGGSGTCKASVGRRGPHAACCATLKLARADLAAFLRLYNNKHWVDGGGGYLSRRCFVSQLRLSSTATLAAMVEFRPPSDMPRGNVGTPTAHFLREIQRCRLPATLIKRLGLVFPRTARRRQYSSVPLDYGTDVATGNDEEIADDEAARTADGLELLARLPAVVAGPTAADARAALPPPAPRASDETAAEETDRHESLHNDVTSQDRTKERLYEEEIELVWEKGGPGLVWYTDEVFWDQQRGDFDERTADDWDVDMAGYEEGAGPADMDARVSRNMRRELQLRDGKRSESAFERRAAAARAPPTDADAPPVGAFECHTRGFGRRVLVNLGWSDGQGLGAAAAGIVEPVEPAGQTDRRGIGFAGEKLERRPARKRRRAGEVVITTAFDDPGETELSESVDRTLLPTHMKFRRPANR